MSNRAGNSVTFAPRNVKMSSRTDRMGRLTDGLDHTAEVRHEEDVMARRARLVKSYETKQARIARALLGY